MHPPASKQYLILSLRLPRCPSIRLQSPSLPSFIFSTHTSFHLRCPAAYHDPLSVPPSPTPCLFRIYVSRRLWRSIAQFSSVAVSKKSLARLHPVDEVVFLLNNARSRGWTDTSSTKDDTIDYTLNPVLSTPVCCSSPL